MLSKTTKPILLALFGIITFITISFLYMGYLHHKLVLEMILKQEQKVASKIYNNTFKNITKRYESIATSILLNKQIIDAFDKKDRKQLFNLTEPIYKKLNTENPHLNNMHFHTKDTKSFLRLHKPEKFGDDLSSIRHLINKANNLKTIQIGMEVGRYGIFYRIALPISNSSGKHLGVFELGIDINYILDTFNEDYGFDTILLLKKDIFKIIYENGFKNLTSTPYSDENYYYIESNGKTVCDCETTGKCYYIDSNLKSNNPLIVKNDGKSDMVFTVNTIKDISNAEIGKLFFVKNLNFYTDKIDNIKYLSIVLVILLLLISFALIRKIFKNYINIVNSYQSKLEIKNRTLVKLSNIDHLTQISNRKSIETTLIKELKRVKRYNHKLSVIIFDLDNFKKINDTYGHNIGDKVLRNVAKIVSSSIRETDYFGRWGGEEFIVISTDTSLDNALIVAEKIRKNISSYDFEEAGHVTCSIGIAENIDDDTHQNIVHNADIALYKAKDTGKNKVVLFEQDIL